MSKFKNTGDFPVHLPLSVGVNAHVTRTAEDWGAEDDPRPALHDTEGVAVVLWPGDLIDTDEQIVSGIVRRVNDAGELIDDEALEPETPEPAPRRSRSQNDADESAQPKE